MLKKLWNHPITVGDSVIVSVVSTAICSVGLAIWYFAWTRDIKRQAASIDHSNGLYEDGEEEN